MFYLSITQPLRRGPKMSWEWQFYDEGDPNPEGYDFSGGYTKEYHDEDKWEEEQNERLSK